ncbi:hypothetical protein MRX96_004396 [Rhipicephalus microplus]
MSMHATVTTAAVAFRAKARVDFMFTRRQTRSRSQLPWDTREKLCIPPLCRLCRDTDASSGSETQSGGIKGREPIAAQSLGDTHNADTLTSEAEFCLFLLSSSYTLSHRCPAPGSTTESQLRGQVLPQTTGVGQMALHPTACGVRQEHNTAEDLRYYTAVSSIRTVARSWDVVNTAAEAIEKPI